MNAPRRRSIDWPLIVQVALVLVLLVLGFLLYWQPALEGRLTPRWWHWVPLAALLFGVAQLHTSRRRLKKRAELRRAIREEVDSLLDTTRG